MKVEPACEKEEVGQEGRWLQDALEVDLGCERHGGQASKIRFNIIR